jgi:hypothetical protein
MDPFPRDRSYLGLVLLMLTLLGASLNACTAFQIPPDSIPLSAFTSLPGSPSPTPFQPIPHTQTSTPSATPLPTTTATNTLQTTPTSHVNSDWTIWVPKYLPPQLTSQLELLDEFGLAESQVTAQVSIEVGDQHTISHWVYALVAPYPTIIDQISAQDLKRSWRGNPQGPFAGEPLLMDASTKEVLSAWWDSPAQGATQVVQRDELLEYAWEHRPVWAIVLFESLEPGWKVLSVDGQSPLRKDFEPASYPLTVPFSIEGEDDLVDRLISMTALPTTNRDPNRLTTVALTGVTALVRATAFSMHRNGITYPARDIGDVLRSADVTHISNEIPFTPDCPPPNPTQVDLRFCSDPDYIALLEEIGTDIVELTGDHFGDWGPQAMLYTLDMYEQRNWGYYGGGYNRKDARQALQIEHNGNRIAFIGCNGKGGGYATASDNLPGAVACDFNWMQKEIARQKEAGYQVIATFQHFEYYTYFPQPDQVRDFQTLAQAGASVVSGSQAHQPQGIEFYKNAFLHYGLGNLFFDQYHYCTDYACDDAFIDLHVFYDGEYLGNELLTIVFEDYARPRLMTQEEREGLLQKIFSASGW